MYASSAAESLFCFSGFSYKNNQKPNHKNPMAPIIMNAASQPQCAYIHGTVNGARMAPMFAPELKIPVASDRSRFGKYSATVLMAAGKFPDSPNASKARENINPDTETETTTMPVQPN